jgi:glycosyltransferase involved in cell wall biosynthesis
VRVAILHHWFVSKGGGEHVAETLAQMYPEADLFALVAVPGMMPASLRDRALHTSFLDRVPFAHRIYRKLLPLYPMAVEQLDLSGYDLVLTSDSGPVKGAIVSPTATHICYCHAPMRYIWDQCHAYRKELGAVSGTIFNMTAHYLRAWDHLAAQRVTQFAANSRCVASRIQQYYGRKSEVIYPPIDMASGYLADSHNECYLTVGRLVRYKRIDLLIEACNRLGRRLRIIGTGPEEGRLRAMAGNTIEFLGYVDDATLWKEYAECRAFLFGGEEDFGMAIVEAQACGRPVIAFGQGGALESVVSLDSASPRSRSTGLFFYEQNAQAAADAILRFEACEWTFNPRSIRERARRFGSDVFCRSFRSLVETTLQAEPADRALQVCI